MKRKAETPPAIIIKWKNEIPPSLPNGGFVNALNIELTREEVLELRDSGKIVSWNPFEKKRENATPEIDF